MGGLDELEAADGEHVGADRPRVEDPAAQRQHADERDRVRADDGDERDREHDHREGELYVGDAHDDGVRPLAAPARQEAHDDADHRGDHHRAHRQGQRGAAAVEEPREDVPAQVVGPEHVGRGAAEAPRRRQALGEARLEGIVRGERRGERARDDDEAQEDAADRHREMAAAEPRRRGDVERSVRHEYRMRGSMTV